MADFFRRTGLLPATAFVVASGAPAAIIRQARILKARYGNLIQICDGVADNVEIQAALTAAGRGRVHCLGQNWYFADTVTIGLGASDYDKQALIFEEGARIFPAADVDLFKLTNNAVLANAIIFTYGLTFTKRAIIVQGQQNRLQHIAFRGDTGVGKGTALLLDDTGTAFFVLYNKFDDIRIHGYEYGIRVKQNVAERPVFINWFTRIDGYHIVHFIYETKATESLHLNLYEFTYQAFGVAESDIDCLHVEGNYSRFYGSTSDFAGATAITVVGGALPASYNLFDLRGSETEGKVSDSGNYSRFMFQDNSIKGSGSINIGANKLKTTNNLIREVSVDTLAIRNAADNTYSSLALAELNPYAGINFPIDGRYLQAVNSDNGFVMFRARDNGVGIVEIARLQGAAEPHLLLTHSKVGARALPAASADFRGFIYRVEGGAGVADKLYMCMKSTADTYSWIQVAIG